LHGSLERACGTLNLVKKVVAIGALAALLVGGRLAINSQQNRVTRIIDGDTIEISGNKRHVRLIGIDTAEVGECYRDQSSKMTAGLLLGQQVKVETDINEMDNFGRVLGYVYTADGTMVNRKLLEAGAGEFFYDSVNVKYQKELIAAAENARANEVGFWKTCGPCVVKGNYDIHGKRYYHLPEFRHYESVVVNLDKADRWFCGEEAASKAGFIRARE
jgi:micrococcal nuclease